MIQAAGRRISTSAPPILPVDVALLDFPAPVDGDGGRW